MCPQCKPQKVAPFPDDPQLVKSVPAPCARAGFHHQLCASPQHLWCSPFMVHCMERSIHHTDGEGEFQKHQEIFLDLASVTPNKELIYQCQLKDAALDRKIERYVSPVWKSFYEWQLCTVPVASHNASPLQIPRQESDKVREECSWERANFKDRTGVRELPYMKPWKR